MGIKEIIIRRTVWKGIRRVIQVLGSSVASPAVTYTLAQFGLTVDVTVMTAALTGLTESGLNVLKQRYPSQLGWL